MNTSDILQRAADRLRKPGAWTQGACARNVDGHGSLNGRWKDAVCWCIVGAIDAEAPDSPTFTGARHRFLEYLGTDCVSDWNDDPARTQEQVVAALESAAELARGEEGND